MIFVGIDFSLNSPGICLSDAGEFTFLSVFNTSKVYKGKKELLDTDYDRYPEISLARRAPNLKMNLVRYESPDGSYDQKQAAKLINNKERVKNIVKIITDNVSTHDIIIGIEGYSYSSATTNIIDIAETVGILKYVLAEWLGAGRIHTFAPSEIKKFATGKGNANKVAMYEKFLEQELALAEFLKKEKMIEEYKNILSPFDDLIDAYYIAKILESKNAN